MGFNDAALARLGARLSGADITQRARHVALRSLIPNSRHVSPSGLRSGHQLDHPAEKQGVSESTLSDHFNISGSPCNDQTDLVQSQGTTASSIAPTWTVPEMTKLLKHSLSSSNLSKGGKKKWMVNIPGRSRKAMSMHRKKMITALENCRPWTAREDENIKRLNKLHEISDGWWRIVSVSMKRSRMECRVRFCLLKCIEEAGVQTVVELKRHLIET